MVYRDSGAELQNCIFLTGSEAVSKSVDLGGREGGSGGGRE